MKKKIDDIKGSNIIDDIKKSPTKRDDKVRTFGPKEPETYQNIEEISYLPTYDEKSNRLELLTLITY